MTEDDKHSFPPAGWLKRILTTSLQMHHALQRLRDAMPPREKKETFLIEDTRPYHGYKKKDD